MVLNAIGIVSKEHGFTAAALSRTFDALCPALLKEVHRLVAERLNAARAST